MRTFVVLFAALLLCPSAARCADLDAIEADICNKWDNIKSATYDMITKTQNQGQGFSMDMDSTGTAEMKRKSDKVWLMRMDSKMNSVMKVQGNETKTASTTMMVVDGEYSYSVTDSNGQKFGMKSKAQDWSDNAGGKGFFKFLREHHDLKVLADETVDGVSCYVVEATPKKEGAQAMAMKYCFAKDSGMSIKIETKGPDGKVMSTTRITNLKMNSAIADDRFVFTAPPGVVMQDMTKAPNAGAREESAPPPAKNETAVKKTEEEKPEKKETAESKPKEEPKKEEPKKEEPKKKRKIPGF